MVPIGYKCIICREKKGATIMLLNDLCQWGCHMASLSSPMMTLSKVGSKSIHVVRIPHDYPQWHVKRCLITKM
jgi:hypothetical protein